VRPRAGAPRQPPIAVATDATALAAPAPVTVLTSDPEDLTALCDARTTAIKI